MTAFLKIDNCGDCHRALPWEFVPAVIINGKTLSGTGVWASQLVDNVCLDCRGHREAQREKEKRYLERRTALIELLGGEKPYREFTFDRYRVQSGNRLAYERSRNFNPATDNLYLWGACGLGKTHLTWAIARSCFEETLSVVILRTGQLSRQVRMKEAGQEQATINDWVAAELLVLDDVGTGNDTAYSRQILQEILDQRDFQDRAGLVITTKYSLSDLARKLGDDAIPSRLAGMCHIVEVKGLDQRLRA